LCSFIKGICEALLGSTVGALIILVNLWAGILIALGFRIAIRLKKSEESAAWGLVGAVANFPQAPFFWIVAGRIFILHWSLAMLAFIFAFVSGYIVAGLLGKAVVARIQR
jgi:ABC-type thiamin/hydroxymethylpyrimidine transport system permease subunit